MKGTEPNRMTWLVRRHFRLNICRSLLCFIECWYSCEGAECSPRLCTQAWHKLNFHMNCNLSIVYTQCHFFYLSTDWFAWILVSLFDVCVYRKKYYSKIQLKKWLNAKCNQIFLSSRKIVKKKLFRHIFVKTYLCLHFLKYFFECICISMLLRCVLMHFLSIRYPSMNSQIAKRVGKKRTQ